MDTKNMEQTRRTYRGRAWRRQQLRRRVALYLTLLIVSLVDMTVYLASKNAAFAFDVRALEEQLDSVAVLQGQNARAVAARLREAQFRAVGSRTVTMYTSRPEETDRTPCVGSSGQDQCALWLAGQDVCASNEFALGTVLYVEGLGECTVLDRMNARYDTNVDWYAGFDPDCLDGYDKYDVCPRLQEAVRFGARQREVRVLNQN